MPAHLTHVALFVRDIDRTVDFYGRFAGLHIVHDRVDDGVRVVWLSEQDHDPDFVIVAIRLSPGAAAEPPHMAHFGYDLPSRAAVDDMAARGRAEGILVQGPADAGRIVGYFCMLRDPDGNLVEFSHGQPINPKHLR
ncbi:MAG TPA: VOC family protein [Candidatus Margulisiibacteriota bacterium]|nr:VOC family protein [Candidatus Margulisiibacteriota bacterium]